MVAFDLDGTLLPRTSVTQWLATRLGHGEEIETLERRFRAREISNSVIADASAAWLAGLTRAEVRALLEPAGWIPGIASSVTELKASGCQVVLATVGWRFAAEFVQQRFAFDAVCGTEMELSGETLTGRVARYFDEHDKLRFVDDFCRGAGCALEHCVAVGDSRSDVPLFRHAGFSIALNATSDARAAASTTVDAEHLQAVTEVILRLLEPRPPSPG